MRVGVHPTARFPTSVLLDVGGGWWGRALLCKGAGKPSGLLYLLTSLCLSLPLFTMCDDGGPLLLDDQRKTPMTVLGSPHTLKPLKPPCLATQGKSRKKRRKVRCPSSGGLFHEAAGWGLHKSPVAVSSAFWGVVALSLFKNTCSLIPC